MAPQFSATQIACVEEEGVLTVAFGGEPVGEGDPPYLLFSRTLDPEPQDVRLGHDRPYFELSDQSKSTYGGISSVHLSPRHIRVVLDAEGVRRLGDTEIYVSLTTATELGSLEKALRRVLDGIGFECDAV